MVVGLIVVPPTQALSHKAAGVGAQLTNVVFWQSRGRGNWFTGTLVVTNLTNRERTIRCVVANNVDSKRLKARSLGPDEEGEINFSLSSGRTISWPHIRHCHII